MTFKPAHTINEGDILHVISGLMQSNRDEDSSKGFLQSSISVEVTRLRMPYCAPIKPNNTLFNKKNTVNNSPGPSNVKASEVCPISPNDYDSFTKYCKNKRSIICIDNTDNMSLPKAVVVGKALIKKHPEYELIRKNRKNRQSHKAKKLLQKIGFGFPKGGFGHGHLAIFQNKLKKYNLKVYQYKSGGYKLVFDGTNPEAQHDINLIRCNGHYNLLSKIIK